jgi:hypothetical protein
MPEAVNTMESVSKHVPWNKGKDRRRESATPPEARLVYLDEASGRRPGP